MNGRFVSYYRVSTAQQGRSGLGLEAQREAVCDFLNGGDWTLAGEFTEVESGKRTDRPQLDAALSLADSDEGGHLFQSDPGHHSNLMAAR
jgi:DNA invertase Pin-like site-specific DNA recombinase